MRSFEDIKKEVQTNLEWKLNYWEKDTTTTPSIKEARINECKKGLENIDEMVQQQIAHEAVDLLNLTGKGLLDTNRVKSVNRLFISQDDKEYKFLSEHVSDLRINNMIVKDEFLKMVSERYGFEIPSLKETTSLETEINKKRNELFEKYKYSTATEEFQEYLELEQLESKLYSNEIAFGKHSDYCVTQADARERYVRKLEQTKNIIDKSKSENSELSDGMHM